MYQLGYCTNVHAGADLDQTRRNLQQHAVAVKQQCSPDQPMGVGLWLSARSADELVSRGEAPALRQWLAEHGLVPFTLNGFPFGDFHQQVVKHGVYQPTWWDEPRLRYTKQLIDILDAILPEGREGSISTLPVAWGDPAPAGQRLETAARQLAEVARYCGELERRNGRLIYLCIEPEPGCFIQRSTDLVAFFETHLLPAGEHEQLRRHIRVCHDVCHAAVMFEPQRAVLDRYRQAGIRVGKVQISSAVRAEFGAMPPHARTRAIQQLQGFAEDRYLHQTTIQHRDGSLQFIEDLPLAIQRVSDPAQLDEHWRIHFHVPVYLQEFGLLQATRDEILECLDQIRDDDQLTHLEVETYAWSVLPPELQLPRLADGIAREMDWMTKQLAPA